MQFLIIVYIFIAVLFIVYLVLGIQAFHKYLHNDNTTKSEEKKE